jgi:hypothetical protein
MKGWCFPEIDVLTSIKISFRNDNDEALDKQSLDISRHILRTCLQINILDRYDKNQKGRSCKKRKSTTQSQERQEYPIYSKKEGYVDWPHTAQELPSKTRY